MDTRLTPEQSELRRSAARLARDLGPDNVASLADGTRRRRLARAVQDAGWWALRADGGDGGPMVGGVEAAIVAEELAARVVDVAYLGPVLAADLARRAGLEGGERAVVAHAASLVGPAVPSGSSTEEPLYVVDDPGDDGRERVAYVLVPDERGFRLGRVALAGTRGEGRGADLTRAVEEVAAGTRVEPVASAARRLTEDDVVAWTALGLALTSADLVGAMRGVIDVTVDYASQRRQFGVPVGSFQAVQHLLAEARCLMEGSLSVARHAAWAVDNLSPLEARQAGRLAKAYCARAARTVCETAVQAHGGIGNTWECIVHVYLRRALLSTQWFGDDGEQLRELARERLGVVDGLARERLGATDGLP